MKKLALLSLLALLPSLYALPEAPNLEAALPQASAEHRSVILDLTGTDWCPACVHLTNKILKSDEFEKAVGEKYILVSVDYPRTPELVAKITPEQWKERFDMLHAYGIEGLPALLLMDEQGLPYGIILGTRRTPADFLPLLEEQEAQRSRRDAAFAKAAGLSGLERAKALDEGLKALPERCRDKYGKLIDEICSLDPEDRLGYGAASRRAKRLVEQKGAFLEMTRGFVGKLKAEELESTIVACENFRREHAPLEPEVEQECLNCMADAYAMKRDFFKNYELTKQAYEAAPETRLARKLKAHMDYFDRNIRPNLKPMEAEEKAGGAAPESKPEAADAPAVN